MQNPGKTLGSRQKALNEKLPHLKQVGKHDSRIVSTEQELIEFSKLGGIAMFNIHKTYFCVIKSHIILDHIVFHICEVCEVFKELC